MSLFRAEALKQRGDRLNGEIVFTQSLSTKLYVTALFGIIIIVTIWVNVGTYARIETAPGVLVTSLPSAKIVALQAGTVSELAVIEGQLVKRGDRLLVINSDRVAIRGGDVAGRGLGALDARRQLAEAQVAMVGGKAEVEQTRLSTVIASAEQQAVSLLEQIAFQEQLVASNKQMFEQVTAVVERGFISKVEFERRRQNLLSSQQTLSSLNQRLIATIAEAKQARNQRAGVVIDEEQSKSRIREILQTLSGEQARLEGEQSYAITAPISGRVAALTTGVGRSMNASKPIMVIVPEMSELIAELYAPTRAIGSVEPGKETRLLFDAFPYQRFGSFVGEIVSISRIAIDPRETDIPFPFEEPVYRIKVKLKDQPTGGPGGRSLLQPGMTLQANIVLERQTFLAWLLHPLNAILNRAS